MAVQRRGGYFEYLSIYVSDIPIIKINFSNPSEKTIYEQIVNRVEKMLFLHSTHIRIPQEKDTTKREIDATDRQIDKLVYELYGLTEEEIMVVESYINS